MHRMTSLLAAFMIAAFIHYDALAGDRSKIKNTRSAELDRLTVLEGTWKGEQDKGQGPQEVVVKYAMTAAGSALIETIHQGTPMEMVSVYHDDTDDTLTMTHFCMLGNQPRMNLASADESSISLTLDKTCGIDVEKEDHMHALRIVLQSDNEIEHHWTLFEGGKKKDVHSVTLTRVEIDG
jgi:hypothetical protein